MKFCVKVSINNTSSYSILNVVYDNKSQFLKNNTIKNTKRSNIAISVSLFIITIITICCSFNISNCIALRKNLVLNKNKIRLHQDKQEKQDISKMNTKKQVSQSITESLLCSGGKFLNTLSSLNQTCGEAYKSQCDLELKLDSSNKVDKVALNKLIEDQKKKIIAKENELIVSCDKYKIDLFKQAKEKLKNGNILSEREKYNLGLEDNLQVRFENNLYCAEGRHLNKRYCCAFDDSSKTEWFLESVALNYIGDNKQ